MRLLLMNRDRKLILTKNSPKHVIASAVDPKVYPEKIIPLNADCMIFMSLEEKKCHYISSNQGFFKCYKLHLLHM
jgi:hypothetical protein